MQIFVWWMQMGSLVCSRAKGNSKGWMVTMKEAISEPSEAIDQSVIIVQRYNVLIQFSCGMPVRKMKCSLYSGIASRCVRGRSILRIFGRSVGMIFRNPGKATGKRKI